MKRKKIMTDLEFQIRKLSQLGDDLTRMLPSMPGPKAALVCDVLNRLELCLQILERIAADFGESSP